MKPIKTSTYAQDATKPNYWVALTDPFIATFIIWVIVYLFG